MEKDNDSFVIRPAQAKDVPSINKIFNYYIINTTVTFTTIPPTDKQALDEFEIITSRGLLYLVAVRHDTEEVVGYCYAGTFRRWNDAYKHSAELSIYCAPEATGKGIGTRILRKFIEILKALNKDPQSVRDWFLAEPVFIKSVIAVMAVNEDAQKNRKIQHFQDQFGFKQVARFEQVGFKFGKWNDTVYLQLMIA